MHAISPQRPHAQTTESATLATQKRRAHTARQAKEFAKPLLPEQEPTRDATRTDRPSDTRQQLIAVTAGLPTGPELVADPEEVLRRQLAERAGLVDLSPVLAKTAPRSTPATEPVSTTSKQTRGAETPRDPLVRGKTPEPPPLLGEGRTLEDSDTGRVRAEAPVRSAPRPEPALAERQQLERSGRQRAERADDPQSLERMSTIGPQAGNVPPREATREGAESRPGSSGRAERLPGEDLARRELTQAGVVEAQQSRDLFARFLAGTPERDPGPVPRPHEVLGIRSRPISLEV